MWQKDKWHRQQSQREKCVPLKSADRYTSSRHAVSLGLLLCCRTKGLRYYTCMVMASLRMQPCSGLSVAHGHSEVV